MKLKKFIKNKIKRLKRIHKEQKVLIKAKITNLKSNTHFIPPHFFHPMSVARGK